MYNVHHDQPTSHTRSRVRSADYGGPSSPSFEDAGTTHARGILPPAADRDMYDATRSPGARSTNAWAPRYAAPTPASCSAPPGHRPTARFTPPPWAAEPLAPRSGEMNDRVPSNDTSSSSAYATPWSQLAEQQWADVDDLDAGVDVEASSSTASSAYGAHESWADAASLDGATSSTTSSAGGAAGAWNDGAAFRASTAHTASSTGSVPEAWADEAAFDEATASTTSRAGYAREDWASEGVFAAHTMSTSSSAGDASESWADEVDAGAYTSSTASSAGHLAWSAAGVSSPRSELVVDDLPPQDAAEFPHDETHGAWFNASTSSSLSSSSSSAWYADAQDDGGDDLEAPQEAGAADDRYATPSAGSGGPSAALSAAYRSLDRAFEQLELGGAEDADEAATSSGASFEPYGAQPPRSGARPKCFLATGSSTSANSDAGAWCAEGGRSDASLGHGRTYAGYEG